MTPASCDRNTQLLEVLWCGLMATLEDDEAELENYPIWIVVLKLETKMTVKG